MSGFVAAYESFFAFLGIESPFKRFLLGTALGFTGQMLIKPSLSYTSNGKAKSFPSQTYLPWYLLAVIPGLIWALFL